MTKSQINMTFITNESKKASINIKNPKDDVTAADVKAVMDTIIATNGFQTSAGTFVNKESAKLVTTTETEYEL